MVRARACAKLGRSKEGLEHYDSAVAQNPTLEDVTLRTLLGARPVDRGGTRLRVIANDDTDVPEVTRLLHPETTRVRFADVGGLAEVKEQILQAHYLLVPEAIALPALQEEGGGGIPLNGPPGCGKTLLARATAGECDASFFNVAITDVLDMYIGEAERKLHAIFDQARQKTPAVVFFDELEALAAKRTYTREGDVVQDREHVPVRARRLLAEQPRRPRHRCHERAVGHRSGDAPPRSLLPRRLRAATRLRGPGDTSRSAEGAAGVREHRRGVDRAEHERALGAPTSPPSSRPRLTRRSRVCSTPGPSSTSRPTTSRAPCVR